jgi:uncharacterized protein Veg
MFAIEELVKELAGQTITIVDGYFGRPKHRGVLTKTEPGVFIVTDANDTKLVFFTKNIHDLYVRKDGKVEIMVK